MQQSVMRCGGFNVHGVAVEGCLWAWMHERGRMGLFNKPLN